MPSVNEVSAVNRLALTTGSNPVPNGKRLKGYRYVKSKFELAKLTPAFSHTITAPRIEECPVQMEAILQTVHPIAEDDEEQNGKILTMEFRVQRVYLEESILMNGSNKRVDPDKWKPLIMSFQKFYGLGSQIYPSNLSKIPEVLYHSPDMDKARKEFEKIEV